MDRCRNYAALLLYCILGLSASLAKADECPPITVEQCTAATCDQGQAFARCLTQRAQHAANSMCLNGGVHMPGECQHQPQYSRYLLNWQNGANLGAQPYGSTCEQRPPLIGEEPAAGPDGFYCEDGCLYQEFETPSGLFESHANGLTCEVSEEPPCEGPDCEEPPCEGPDCEEPPCEGDDCEEEPPCEGPGCNPPCQGDDCPCVGDDCPEPCDPGEPGCVLPCPEGDCGEPPCEGEDCEEPPCEGEDCGEEPPCDPETDEDCEEECDPNDADCQEPCDPETEECEETPCDPETEECEGEPCDPDTENCEGEEPCDPETENCFCEANPTHPACGGDLGEWCRRFPSHPACDAFCESRPEECNGECDPETQDCGDGEAQGGTSCSNPPNCRGDVVGCMIARQTWETRCEVERLRRLQQQQTDGEDVDTPPSVDGDPQTRFSGSELGVGVLDQSGLGLGGACGQNISISVLSSTVTIPIVWCDLLVWLGYLVMASGFYVSARILGGS